MNLLDHLMNNSKIKVEFTELNQDDPENVYITEDTRFDYTLTINFADGKALEISDVGEWVLDNLSLSEYEGKPIELARPLLLHDIKMEILKDQFSHLC